MEQNEGAKVVNPLLGKLRLPGQTFRLPSHGLFYTNGELDASVKNGEVEVYPMTAIDEIVLTTPDKLLSGKAISDVFMRCIPQVRDPNQLLSKDVDFLLACLRVMTFGSTIEVKYQHNCEIRKKDEQGKDELDEKGKPIILRPARNHTYNINMENVINSARPLDPTTITKDFNLTMPNGQKVIMQPLTYACVVDLYQNTMMAKQLDENAPDENEEAEIRKFILATLSGIVRSVDGETNRAMIEEWLFAIPLGWKKQIENTAQQSGEWGAKFEVVLPCKDCGASVIFPVSPNPVSFFI